MNKFLAFSLCLLFLTSLSYADKRNKRKNYDYWYVGYNIAYYNPYAGGPAVGYSNRSDNHYYYVVYDPLYYDYYDRQYYARKYEREYRRAISEIAALEEKKVAAFQARQELSLIKVSKAKFYKQYTTDTLPISMAEVTIDNGSHYSIRKIHFLGNLKTHITNKVLINEGFSYEAVNTLHSNDRATYKIPLNAFGSWSKARPPDLAIFTVTVTGIETDDGRFITSNFSSVEQQRLDRLKEKYIY